MKRLVITWLLLVLFLGLCVPVRGSVKVEAVINEGVSVAFFFENITSAIWDNITSPEYSYLFNETTFPQIIVGNLEQRNLTRVDYSLPDKPLEFDNFTRSMRVRFYLSDADILSSAYNRTSMSKTYRVNVEWRKFYANFTSSEGVHIFTLDFRTYFGAPLDTWSFTEGYLLNNENRSAYFYNSMGPSAFGSLNMSFVLPKGAIPRSPEGDAIVFELPPAFWDVLLSSPVPIVGAIIVVSVAVVLYRRIRGT